MKKALLDGSRICQVSDLPFPVAAPLQWVDVPDGTTTAQQVVAGAVVALPPPVVLPTLPTPRQWLDRLPADTQARIWTAALSTPSLLGWVVYAAGGPTITVTDQKTVDGVTALFNAGVLTAPERDLLLAS